MSSLPSGTRLGPYEILAPLGAGGMGEVYKARDTRLDRTVAVKVIQTTVAATPEFRDRFDREARAISALDHPHICTLYDVGHEGDVAYLVMQFIEGETLGDRLARAGRPSSNPTIVASTPASGTPPPGDGSIAATVTSLLSSARGTLSIDLALRYAAEIASALDAAHRRGIVHRDLKPGNVMLTKSGTKLLDFGLAKLATSPLSGFDEAATRMSPFGAVQAGAITGQGAILGTLHYMSPEQIEGREADARSDIFSFGALLFEMLSGRRAFDSPSQAGVIAAIIGADTPELGELADTKTRMPLVARRALDRLLQKCLAKHPDDRWQSAADLSDELRWINDERLRAAEPDAASATSAGPAARPVSRTRERVWMTTAGLAVAAAIGVGVWLYPRPAVAPAPIQFTLAPPDGTTFMTTPGFISASPDGQHIAFGAGSEAAWRLWIRSVGALEPRPLSAANDAAQVTWSPDSRSVLFALGGDSRELKRADLAGGPARTLAETPPGNRPAWSREGIILFTQRVAPQRLMRIPEAGGPATPATEINAAAGEASHGWPAFLNDGKRFIFLARNQDPLKSALYLASLDSMERTHLVDMHSMAELVPGYLLYQRDGTLYAHPFDEAAARFTGAPVPIVEDIQFNPANGRAAFATSRTGLLVYRTGEPSSGDAALSWVDRNGKEMGTIGQPGEFWRGALSPDGRRYVVPVGAAPGRELVMIDIERNISSRFTSDTATKDAPLWTNDGESVVFSMNRKGVLDLYIKHAGGATPERLLYESPEDKFATTLAPDGKLLLFTAGSGGLRRRIWALPLVGPGEAGKMTMTTDGKPYLLFPNESENHSQSRFSPDGKWLAYTAGTGTPNVFVQPFPPTGYREQISATKGQHPAWTDDGQLAFIGADNSTLMVAAVAPDGNKLRVGAPRELFTLRRPNFGVGFTIDARADRFLFVVPRARPSDASAAPLTVIANWPSLLKK